MRAIGAEPHGYWRSKILRIDRKMTLKNWLDARNRSFAWLGKRLGIGEWDAARICNSTPPTLAQVFQVYDLTSGQVTANDFINQIRKANGNDAR